MKNSSANLPSVRDSLRIIFRRKGIIFFTVIAVMGSVFIGLKLNTPVYEAGVRMFISAKKQIQSPYYRDFSDYRATEMTVTQSEIVKSNPIIEQVVLALKLDQRPLDYEKGFCSSLKKMFVEYISRKKEAKLAVMPDQQRQIMRFRMAVDTLKDNVKVEPVRDTDLFHIKVRDFSSVEAASIANVISRSYCIFDLQQQLAELKLKYGQKHLAVMQVNDSIELMRQNLTETPLINLDAFGTASVKIIEPATVPMDPIGFPKVVIIAAAFLFSIFLGTLFSLLLDYSDQRIRTPQDLHKACGIELIGSVPKARRSSLILFPGKKAKARYLQFYRRICENIIIKARENGHKAIIFSSALSREGTTTVVANLGLVLSSELGLKVLMIDANSHNPQLHLVFKKQQSAGLTDLLSGHITLQKAQQEAGKDLWLMTNGLARISPVTMLGSPEMKSLLSSAKDDFDFILVDSPDLGRYRDAISLTGVADSLVLVVREGNTRIHVAGNALEPLRGKREKLLGAILNFREFVIPGFIYNSI